MRAFEYRPITIVVVVRDGRACVDMETKMTVLKNREPKEEFFRAERSGLSVVAKEMQSMLFDGSAFWILMELGDVKVKVCTLSSRGKANPERWFSTSERLKELPESDQAWVKGTVRKIRKLIKVREIQER